MSDIFYQRTEAGRAAVHQRELPISRPARTLLFAIDNRVPGDAWVAQVRGCTAEDLAQLAALGLVVPCPPASAAQRPAARSPAPATAGGPSTLPAPTTRLPGIPTTQLEHYAPTSAELQAVAESCTHDALYTVLTHEAKARFGLVRGLQRVLDIERCVNKLELVALTLRFDSQILDHGGPGAAAGFRAAVAAAAAKELAE